MPARSAASICTGARKTHEVAAGAGAEGVAVRPGRDEVWVSNREAGTITVHDPATLAIRHTVPSPDSIRVASRRRSSLVTNRGPCR